MTCDDTKLESIHFADPNAWSMPVGRLMVIKQPEYDCPVHGTVVDTITFSRGDISKARTFCVECCFDKLIEIGVSEVTEKKP